MCGPLNEDWFIKQLQFLPKKLPVLEQHSREPLVDVTDEETGKIYSVPLQQYLLELILQLQINEAESLMFAQFETLSDGQIKEIATYFYKKVERLTEQELVEANFSKDEINQGRQDIAKLLSH